MTNSKKRSATPSEKPSLSGAEFLALCAQCQRDGRLISRVQIVGTARYRVTLTANKTSPTQIQETPDLFTKQPATAFLPPKPYNDTTRTIKIDPGPF